MAISIRPAQTLFSLLKSGYLSKHLKSDLKAGLVVALVAIPLGLALATAVEVRPEYGIYTVLIAGSITAFLGGSRFQVTGPTAAFVVVLLPIVHQFGFFGLLYAGFLSGLLLLILSFFGFGKIIKMMPFAVVTGFTTGIAIVIFTLQLKDFFGLPLKELPHEYLTKLFMILGKASYFSGAETGIACITLLTLILVRRYFKSTPAPVFAIVLASTLVYVLSLIYPETQITTLGDRYPGGVPGGFPPLVHFWDHFGTFTEFWSYTLKLLPSAITIAVLGAIESLLSAVVADSMTGTSHDPDTELFAQGVGNIVAPFFGGIAATGAIARTATNIRFGAYSPIAAIFHALVAFLFLALGAELLGHLPVAAMAALLVFVAYSMADVHNIKTILRLGQREDKIVFLVCCLSTVLFDMTIGVATGLFFAMVLFVHRLIEQSGGAWLAKNPESSKEFPSLPSHVQLYRLEGQLFFGATQKAIATLSQVSSDARIVILDFLKVQNIDLTALTALSAALETLKSFHMQCYFVALPPQVESRIREFFDESHLRDQITYFSSLSQAIEASTPIHSA